MNNRALGLSLVITVIALFMVQSYVSSIEEKARKKFGTSILVVKAKKDIKEQETLNDTMLKLELVPKNFLEPNSISFDSDKPNEETSKILKSLVGTVAIVPIKTGEQISSNKITEPSVRSGLSPQITPGRRAFPVPVTEVTGVSKLIKPGDRVDLIAVLDQGGGKENRVSKTVFQDLVILSIGKNVTNNVARVLEFDSGTGKEKVRSLSEDTTFSSITVEVEPAQAQVLALILSNNDNTIFISLRNNDDTDRVGIGAMGVHDILGGEYTQVQRGTAGRR